MSRDPNTITSLVEPVVLLRRTMPALTQSSGTAGCVSEDGTGPCADGHALKNPVSVTVSLDGKSVYAASFVSDAVARLNRAP